MLASGEPGFWRGAEGRCWLVEAFVAGNYEELFERHLGLETPLGLPRGYNRLWNKGGILFAPPIR